MKKTIILLKDQSISNYAEQLSDRLGFPVFCSSPPAEAAYALRVDQQGLSLQALKQPKIHPIFIDFTSSKQQYRQQQTSWRKELIARAVGFKQHRHPTIIDATAGFGQDALTLAYHGATVTLIERHPVMAALLEDALNRARQQSLDAAYRMTLIHADAHTILTTLSDSPDAIYLDPMYSHPQTRALAKIEMRLLRELVGPDTDAEMLLPIACQHSPRVVVKRPRQAPPLAHCNPHQRLTGKAARFDIYLTPHSLNNKESI